MNNPMEESLDLIGPKIAVVGLGGAGGNAVDNMIRMGLKGVHYLVCNTDAQALSQSLCPESNRIRLGFNITKGLGAGSSPETGRRAAEESVAEIMQHLEGVHMLFITAGMGGGTGTGSCPVIGKAAREAGILTVGVVTKPFNFEGAQRMRSAERGIEEIKECVDTLLVIPNQNLFSVATETTTFAQAFAMADDVLYSGVRTFTDLMMRPGLVNLDFADISTVMKNMRGKAMMGTGEAFGPQRATEAAEKAIACLLLDDVSIRGANAVLINITGGSDLTLYEVDEAIGRVKEEVDAGQPSSRDGAHIIFGATYDSHMESLRVSVVATGIQQEVDFATEEVKPEEAGEYGQMGSRHSDFSFEAQHFSSFSLREDAKEFDGETEKVAPAPKKRSFFERLVGRKPAEPQNYQAPVATPEPSSSEADSVSYDTPTTKPALKNPTDYAERPERSEKELGKKDFSSSDDLQIPAFLRQNRNGKPYKK
jgi:cell division protein FtsZ